MNDTEIRDIRTDTKRIIELLEQLIQLQKETLKMLGDIYKYK